MWTRLKAGIPRSTPLMALSRRGAMWATFASVSSASFLLAGSIIKNDNSQSALNTVSVDSSIDAFPTKIGPSENKLFSIPYKLVASGVRSVTFVGFKVYGVGLYIPEKSEHTVVSVVSKHLAAHPGQTAKSILDDKAISQELVAEICQKVPFAMKITPVRNTDFGHLRDGLTKSILACPMAKVAKEEVSVGVEQLRAVFSGFRGSVPKNDTLWVLSNKSETTIVHEGKELKTLGTVAEPAIAQILLVSYLSSVKPLSEPLRKNFVAYITGRI